MADPIKMLAMKNYRSLLEAFELNDWKCDHDGGTMKMEYGVNGDYFKMRFTTKVVAERQHVILTSKLPCKFPKERSGAGALVIGAANYALSAGKFDFNVDDGSISFKMTLSYRGSILSKEAYKFLLNYPCWAIDKCYKGFDDVINGKRSNQAVIDEFINNF